MVGKPGQEEAYIARNEFEKLQKIKIEKQLKLAEEEKVRLQKLHYMQCPKCGMELVEIGYQNILIDECTGCEGIWLDAGELESISNLEKSGLDKLFSIFKKD